MDIATLGIAVRSEQVDQANQSLEKFAQVSGSAERAAKGVGTEASKAGRMAAAANDNAAASATKAAAAYGRWERAASMVGRAVGAIAGALATGALIQYADAWSDMQSRVGAAIRDMDAAPAMMQRLVDIANASYSPLDQTVEVYSRNVSVLRDMGRGAAEAADYTEAMNHALVITATRGERATSVTNALSKAMAIGKLQADGLETVLANGGAVAEALAEELGTTVNGLRQMATDGKITGDVIANALISRLGELRDRAAEMPATIGDAFVRMRTNLTAFIGGLDQSTGASQRLAAAIIVVADNIDVIARVAAVAGVALLTAFAPAILAAMASGLTAVGMAGVAAMNAIRIAVMANPLGALAVAITTIVTAVYLFRDEISQVFGVDVVGAVEGAANKVIGTMVGAYQAVLATWEMWPAALGDLGYQAAQLFLDSIVWMAREAISITNGLVASINGALRGAGVDMQLPDLGAPVSAVPSVKLKNPYAGTRAQVGDIAAGAMRDALSRDYVGGAKDATEASRTATDAINDMNSAMSQIAGGDGSGGGAGGGSGGGTAGKAAGALKSMASEAQRAAEASARFVQETAKGFLTDLRSGLEQGKGFFRSFADAAVNALGKIADKLMDNALSGLFGGGGGFGGILGSLFGGGGRNWGAMSASGKYLFDSGGWTGGGSRSGVAGLVHGQEFVVRAGPAAQHRQLLEAINSGRPVSANNNQPGAANQNRGTQTVRIELADGLKAEIIGEANQNAVQIVRQNNAAQQNYRQNGGN